MAKSNYKTTVDGRLVSARKMSMEERANLVACIAQCRETIDTGRDADALAWAKIGMAECHAELLARG